uniref:3-isopropylmalate dehydratase n=1 Tax=Oryza meridionalis TaxID=40149 RepID=A0A0E0CP95_9ORYZ
MVFCFTVPGPKPLTVRVLPHTLNPMAAAAAAAPALSLAEAAPVTAVLAPGPTPSRTFRRRSSVAASRRPALKCHHSRPLTAVAAAAAAAAAAGDSKSAGVFHGECFVVGDNIDTDQIIPAEHLTLVPSKPDEYRKLGSFAFVGLPTAAYPTPFVAPGEETTRYAVIIGGANFGCGSSREHAPVALGAAGARAVVAEGYARIFFRNSVATGEVYPLELADTGAWKECKTGDVVTVELDNCVMINHTSGKQYKLKPIGDAGPVIEAGGIFAYARKTGMIASKSA